MRVVTRTYQTRLPKGLSLPRKKIVAPAFRHVSSPPSGGQNEIDQFVFNWGKRALMYALTLIGAIVGGSLISDKFSKHPDLIPYRQFLEFRDSGRLRNEIVVGRDEVWGDYLAEDGKTIRNFFSIKTDQNLVKSLQTSGLSVKEVTQYEENSIFWKLFPSMLGFLVTVGTVGFYRVRNRKAMERLRTMFNHFEDQLRGRLGLNDKTITMRKVIEVASKQMPFFSENRAQIEGFVHLRNSNEHFGRGINVFAAPPSDEYLQEMEVLFAQLFRPPLLTALSLKKPKILKNDLPIFSALSMLRQGESVLVFRKVSGDLFLFSAHAFLQWVELAFHGDPVVLRGLSMAEVFKIQIPDPFIFFVKPDLRLDEARNLIQQQEASPIPGAVLKYFVVTSDGTLRGEFLGTIEASKISNVH